MLGRMVASVFAFLNNAITTRASYGTCMGCVCMCVCIEMVHGEPVVYVYYTCIRYTAHKFSIVCRGAQYCVHACVVNYYLPVQNVLDFKRNGIDCTHSIHIHAFYSMCC